MTTSEYNQKCWRAKLFNILLQVIKGNYEPEHSQNRSGYEPNYNSANKLLKVTKKDIIIEKPLLWYLQIKLTFK